MIRFSPRPNRAHLVRWREWGEEAFRDAEEQDRPLALFITAFWCGFCQHMDETSLSHDDVLAVLNAFFIPVRVEESQRPDVDLRYNQDGWPTIAFLTPGGSHLLSVNYTAPDDFVTVLARVVEYYRENREALRALDAQPPPPPDEPAEEPAPLTRAVVQEIAGILEGLADPVHGGFGVDSKLLHTEANEFLLYLFEATGEHAHLDHVLLTLARLRESKTFDAQDGGFFRYSSRGDWQEPHPEKLLDDQAALLRNYLHAFLLTDGMSCRETAEGLIAYMDGVLSDAAIHPYFAGCQDYLHGERFGPASEPRPRTAVLDAYVYCDANAHAASGYLDAWWLLGRVDCRERAVEVIEALWRDMRAPDGGMYHYSAGEPRAPGLLGDALAMGHALLDAYAALDEPRYLERARELAAYVVERHRDAAGGFHDISQTGPANLRFPLALLTENATAARFFTRLADLGRDAAYREQARWALRRFPNTHRQHGAFAAGFGHALARLLAPPVTAVLTGRPGDAGMCALLRAARTQLRHANVVIRYEASKGAASARIELDGRSTGPIHDPAQIGSGLLTP